MGPMQVVLLSWQQLYSRHLWCCRYGMYSPCYYVLQNDADKSRCPHNHSKPKPYEMSGMGTIWCPMAWKPCGRQRNGKQWSKLCSWEVDQWFSYTSRQKQSSNLLHNNWWSWESDHRKRWVLDRRSSLLLPMGDLDEHFRKWFAGGRSNVRSSRERHATLCSQGMVEHFRWCLDDKLL